ncbi:MAG TPA: respiratory nitrate reductase subunit gamma [Bryobacteraceae bacterium]|nr:respiratory nitrate reductase subunit gamma [Bryobacteraceae bacterium]
MTSLWTYLDPLFFAILPYVAFFVFFMVTIQRYRSRSFSYTSLSSQFLENRLHFWAVVPFHYGILAVLAGHALAFLIPRELLLWNSHPLRLYVLELTGLIFGILTIVGVVASVIRRLTVAPVGRVTTGRDWILYAMLLFQMATGVAIALALPWGSSWFAAVVTPYIWSLLRLNPQVDFIAPLPWLIKLHIINAYLVIGYFPFTRLVHVLVIPNPYLWRKPQVTRWYARAGRSVS